MTRDLRTSPALPFPSFRASKYADRSFRTAGLFAWLMALAVFAALLTPADASAGPNSNSRIAIHLQPVDHGGACTGASAQPPCSGVITAGRTEPDEYFAYVLIMQGNAETGLAGVQFGIEYDNTPLQGVDIYYWAICATLQFPMPGWPASGTGNMITWDPTNRCQLYEPGGAGTGVVAMVGYFYMGAYSPDVLRIVPRQADGAAKVADCNAVEDLLEGNGVHHDPSYLGFATFSADGTAPGYNPCEAASTIDCTIQGPGSVTAGSTGNIYSAPNVPPGALYTWSVTGSGTIVGPADGTSVEITAGSGSSCQVGVVVSFDGSVTSCTKLVTITPSVTPFCSVQGPSKVEPGSNATYTASTNLTAPAYSWSLTGNGMLSGPTTGPTVIVVAGEPGAFELTLHITSSSGFTTCAKSVTVETNVCLIDGAGSVPAGSAGNIYTGPNIPPGAVASWTVSGSGTIVGPADGTSVDVTAGTGSSFTVALSVLSNGTVTACTKFVTVTPVVTPWCTVQGPSTVDAGSSPSYSATTNLSGPIYAWSLTGDGTLTGSTSGPSVTVLAGEAGGFELRLDISSSGGSTTCTRSVTIQPPTCAIAGPATVGEGTAPITYTAQVNFSATGYTWSITGNGTIASTGPGGVVLVNAGDPGTFELTLQVTRTTGSPVLCTRSVVVEPITCSIQGADPVSAFSTGLTYTTGPLRLETTCAWTISGNATLQGPVNGPWVQVNAGSAGSFDLGVTLERHGRTATCTRTITVSPGGNCTPGRNGAAKILVHLLGATAKNPCGRLAATPPCSYAVIRGRLYPNLYLAYLLVANGNASAGVAGLECGIDYDPGFAHGVDVFSWSLCAYTEQPENGWPYPGSGNIIRWNAATSCQRNEPGGTGTGVVANAGYFYLAAYTPDDFRVTVHPRTGAARVYDCDGCESVIAPTSGPSPLGFDSFTASGTSGGYNPCSSTAVLVVPTTWSRIKVLFE